MKKILFSSTILSLLISISQAGILLDLGVGGGIRNLHQSLQLFYSTSATSINPTEIDFDRKNAVFLYGLIGLPLIPNISFKYLSYSTSANLTNIQGFVFGDIDTSSQKANVGISQDTKELDLNVYYNFPIIKILKFGLGAEILKTNLSASATFVDLNITKSYSKEFTVPIPYLYGGAHLSFAGFLVGADVRYFPKLNIGDFEVSYFYIEPTLGYKVLDLPLFDLVMYGAYQYGKLKVQKDGDEKLYFERKEDNYELGGYIKFSF